MVVDGTAQLLHLERPTLRRHPGAPLPEMGDEAEQRAKEDESSKDYLKPTDSLHMFSLFFFSMFCFRSLFLLRAMLGGSDFFVQWLLGSKNPQCSLQLHTVDCAC